MKHNRLISKHFHVDTVRQKDEELFIWIHVQGQFFKSISVLIDKEITALRTVIKGVFTDCSTLIQKS